MILRHAPVVPFATPGMAHPPGMKPMALSEWLMRDEAFAPQMAYRDRLVAERRETVLAGDGTGAAGECLSLVLSLLGEGYEVSGEAVTRPDGARVPVDRAAPLATLGRLAQEDFLILEKPDGAAQHVLTGGVLAFPSRWSLAEKMRRPLTAIHARVPGYEDALAPRVQRLFDVLRPDRPLWRANWLIHPTPELYQPVHEAEKMDHKPAEAGRFWLRVERQALVRLPETGAVVFSVKTLVTALEDLAADQMAALIDAMDDQSPEMRAYHGGVTHHDAARARMAEIVRAS